MSEPSNYRVIDRTYTRTVYLYTVFTRTRTTLPRVPISNQLFYICSSIVTFLSTKAALFF